MRRRKSIFDLSHNRKLSVKFGYLYPILVEDVLPGDTFKLNTSMLMRLAPQLAPVMHEINVYTHFFFVPNRLVWKTVISEGATSGQGWRTSWEEFITGHTDFKPDSHGQDTHAKYYPPILAFSTDADDRHLSVGDIFDHLYNMPATVLTAGLESGIYLDALPLRAYNLIWNEWYRDQDLQEPVAIDFAGGTPGGSDVDTVTSGVLLKRNYEKDYFTSCRPWRQKGPAALIPMPSAGVRGYAPVIRNGVKTPFVLTDLNGRPIAPSGTNVYTLKVRSNAPGRVDTMLEQFGSNFVHSFHGIPKEVEGSVTSDFEGDTYDYPLTPGTKLRSRSFNTQIPVYDDNNPAPVDNFSFGALDAVYDAEAPGNAYLWSDVRGNPAGHSYFLNGTGDLLDSTVEGAVRVQPTGSVVSQFAGDEYTPEGTISTSGGVYQTNVDTHLGTLIDPNGTLYADLNNVVGEPADPDGPYTINDLRLAVQLQNFLEINARSGVRYVEHILGHFGVRSSDRRLDRPEFLGGGRSPVIFSEVLQTSGTTNAPVDGTPQGTMAGHGISVQHNHSFLKTFEEHGWIIGLLSVIPRTAYSQGVARRFRRFGIYDYFWPELAHIGEQAVFKYELYADSTTMPASTLTPIFGYQSRYQEYKTRESSFHGDFRGELSYWHDARIFTSAPSLNGDFISCDPSTDGINRIFATGVTTDKLWIDIHHNLTAIRPIPKHAHPGLMDHVI